MLTVTRKQRWGSGLTAYFKTKTLSQTCLLHLLVEIKIKIFTSMQTRLCLLEFQDMDPEDISSLEIRMFFFSNITLFYCMLFRCYRCLHKIIERNISVFRGHYIFRLPVPCLIKGFFDRQKLCLISFYKVTVTSKWMIIAFPPPSLLSQVGTKTKEWLASQKITSSLTSKM